MDNIEREFSYKVSCVETSCDRTFNLCQVIDVSWVVTPSWAPKNLAGRAKGRPRDTRTEAAKLRPPTKVLARCISSSIEQTNPGWYCKGAEVTFSKEFLAPPSKYPCFSNKAEIYEAREKKENSNFKTK